MHIRSKQASQQQFTTSSASHNIFKAHNGRGVRASTSQSRKISSFRIPTAKKMTVNHEETEAALAEFGLRMVGTSPHGSNSKSPNSEEDVLFNSGGN